MDWLVGWRFASLPATEGLFKRGIAPTDIECACPCLYSLKAGEGNVEAGTGSSNPILCSICWCTQTQLFLAYRALVRHAAEAAQSSQGLAELPTVGHRCAAVLIWHCCLLPALLLCHVRTHTVAFVSTAAQVLDGDFVSIPFVRWPSLQPAMRVSPARIDSKTVC